MNWELGVLFKPTFLLSTCRNQYCSAKAFKTRIEVFGCIFVKNAVIVVNAEKKFSASLSKINRLCFSTFFESDLNSQELLEKYETIGAVEKKLKACRRWEVRTLLWNFFVRMQRTGLKFNLPQFTAFTAKRFKKRAVKYTFSGIFD